MFLNLKIAGFAEKLCCFPGIFFSKIHILVGILTAGLLLAGGASGGAIGAVHAKAFAQVGVGKVVVVAVVLVYIELGMLEGSVVAQPNMSGLESKKVSTRLLRLTHGGHLLCNTSNPPLSRLS